MSDWRQQEECEQEEYEELMALEREAEQWELQQERNYVNV
jgi:hypothetical protein